MLEAREISFRYAKGARKIWHNYNMEIKQGEIVGFIAPSGFGKTTFCKILAGYEKAEKGEVLIDGKKLESYKGYCPVQMIWQHPEEAINPRRKMKTVLREADEIQEDVIRAVGIEDEWQERFPSELSGGQLQRFCIARALGKKTKFLLADEITSMLDLVTQGQIWNFLIEQSRKRNIGILAISHSEDLLEKICTRIIKLE